MGRLQFALCGNCTSNQELNPYAVSEPAIRQEILCLINQEPSTSAEVARALGIAQQQVEQHLSALERAGLVKRSGPGYKPTFAIFTLQDQERLDPVIGEMTGRFVEVIQENMGGVRRTYADCGFLEHGFPFADMAYILVGAYILDYGGLALLEAGFLVAAKEMPGGAYVFWAFEGKRGKLRESWMWGHACKFGQFTFFGHGELPAEGGRKAVPEQAYRWQAEGWSEEKVTRVMEELGTILVALYEEPLAAAELATWTGIEPGSLAQHLALLQRLWYVEERERWYSTCPIVDKATKARIQKMVQELWAKLLAEVVKRYWSHWERLYQRTAPARNGIDIREAFNPIHHAIFEQALRLLMEQGTIPWPKVRPDGARYAVWVEQEAEWPTKTDAAMYGRG